MFVIRMMHTGPLLLAMLCGCSVAGREVATVRSAIARSITSDSECIMLVRHPVRTCRERFVITFMFSTGRDIVAAPEMHLYAFLSGIDGKLHYQRVTSLKFENRNNTWVSQSDDLFEFYTGELAGMHRDIPRLLSPSLRLNVFGLIQGEWFVWPEVAITVRRADGEGSLWVR